MYLQGRPPPSVNMYWRRFAISEMPLDDSEKFDLWLRERWYEKDKLMDQYISTGRFPPSKTGIIMAKGEMMKRSEEEYIETEVKLAHRWEVINIFVVLLAFALVANLGAKAWNQVLYGRQY